MSAEHVKDVVAKCCIGFKKNERIAFQRYFLAYFFPYYKHEGIAEMTDKCDRATVCKTIKRISQHGYYPIREKILATLIVEKGKPKYKWIKP